MVIGYYFRIPILYKIHEHIKQYSFKNFDNVNVDYKIS